MSEPVPVVPLTPVVISFATLPCVHQQCILPIRPGDPIVMLTDGWMHAVHKGQR
jgi:hypothetical protein